MGTLSGEPYQNNFGIFFLQRIEVDLMGTTEMKGR
jgi:hypothetical protein